MILTAKMIDYTRERRRFQESPGTRLKKSRKRAREKQLAIAYAFIR